MEIRSRARGKLLGGSGAPQNYVSIATGLAIFNDSDLDDPILPSGISGGLTAEIGFMVGGAIGHRFKNGMRAELEVAYRRNDLDEISIGGFGLSLSVDIDGTISSLSALANGYYDFPFQGPIIPFVGAGLGLARINVESNDLGADDSDTVFAYQFAAGLTHSISSHLALTGAYKFFATADPKFGTTEGEYQSHNFEVSLTYGF